MWKRKHVLTAIIGVVVERNNMKEIVRNYILAILFTFLWVGIIISLNKLCFIKNRNKELVEENQNLTVEIAELQNEIYALSLDLDNTKATLATTANELDILASKEIDNLQLNYVGEYTCTAYCCEKYPHICGTGSGNTASGAPVTPDISVAVSDTSKFPFGTIIYIEDVGIRIVQDTGTFGSSMLDVAVDTHQHALHWEGRGKHRVWIVEVK